MFLLFLGMVIGTTVGILVSSLCVIAARSDEDLAYEFVKEEDR